MPNWSLRDRDPQFIQACMPIWEWFYRYYFRVKTSGWEHMPKQGSMLLVGSHSGGLAMPDTHMFLYDWFRRYGVERPAYGLLHQSAWENPNIRHYAAKMGALAAQPQPAIAALREGAAVLVYPGGIKDLFRPHHQRHQICLAEEQGFIKLALREKVPIVPVISTGSHDTLIVLTDFYDELKQLREWDLPGGTDWIPESFPVYLGWPWGLGLGALPNIPFPIQLKTRVCTPIWFEDYGREATRDRDYVEACYRRVRDEMQQALDQLVRS